MKHYISVVKSCREKVSLLAEIGVTITMVWFVEKSVDGGGIAHLGLGTENEGNNEDWLD